MEAAPVISQERLAKDICSMWIEASFAKDVMPGQFISLYTQNDALILPRPISICEVSADKRSLRLVYRIVGEGTREFSSYKKGDTVRILGPLGNGFPLKDKRALLIAGGIGIPPMLELAKGLKTDKTMAAGYRDSSLFLKDDLEKHAKLIIATEDGSYGTRGNVIDAIRENNADADIIYACGPMPMLKAVKEYAGDKGIEAYVSLEERMACGIGACLGCVCRTGEVDEHSKVNNRRICKDGPVFLASEVEL